MFLALDVQVNKSLSLQWTQPAICSYQDMRARHHSVGMWAMPVSLLCMELISGQDILGAADLCGHSSGSSAREHPINLPHDPLGPLHGSGDQDFWSVGDLIDATA